MGSGTIMLLTDKRFYFRRWWSSLDAKRRRYFSTTRSHIVVLGSRATEESVNFGPSPAAKWPQWLQVGLQTIDSDDENVFEATVS